MPLKDIIDAARRWEYNSYQLDVCSCTHSSVVFGWQEISKTFARNHNLFALPGYDITRTHYPSHWTELKPSSSDHLAYQTVLSVDLAVCPNYITRTWLFGANTTSRLKTEWFLCFQQCEAAPSHATLRSYQFLTWNEQQMVVFFLPSHRIKLNKHKVQITTG